MAIVVLDQPAELATGGMLAVGEIIQETLGLNPALPFVWHVVDSEEKARKGKDNRDFYGAVVLPVDLATGLLSLATSTPTHNVKLITNEGMSTQASMVIATK